MNDLPGCLAPNSAHHSVSWLNCSLQHCVFRTCVVNVAGFGHLRLSYTGPSDVVGPLGPSPAALPPDAILQMLLQRTEGITPERLETSPTNAERRRAERASARRVCAANRTQLGGDRGSRPPSVLAWRFRGFRERHDHFGLFFFLETCSGDNSVSSSYSVLIGFFVSVFKPVGPARPCSVVHLFRPLVRAVEGALAFCSQTGNTWMRSPFRIWSGRRSICSDS